MRESSGPEPAARRPVLPPLMENNAAMLNKFVGRQRQGGAALMVMLTLLTIFGLYVFVGQLNAKQY